jgi:nicotinamide-nucleotide amidase
MNAIILSIGDELVLGQTVDTNSAWLSQQLAAVGVGIAAHVTVSDDQSAIEDAIRQSVGRCEILLISGGLGPTDDDLTRQALAAVMGAPLEMNEAWLKRLRDFFRQRGRPMPEANAIQAMIPRGARMIENTAGTAPGIYATLSSNPQSEIRNPQSLQIFVMPGVPKEMKIMFERDVLPALRDAGGGGVILSRTLHTFGLGESSVAEMLGELMKRGRNPSVGTTVSQGIVSLRLNARFGNRAEAERELALTEGACRAALGDLIFGADGQPLAEVVGLALKLKGQTVATAESCTGGLLAKMLTDISGSSDYFRYGWVTYANEAKMAELGVPEQTLMAHGAVSDATVRAMAEGARQRARADYALAISGVAGPTGGTADKPVGTVCIALASGSGTTARTFNFPGDREMIRDRSAKMALTMLRYHLLGKPLPC